MRNTDWSFSSLISWFASKRESRVRPRYWILSISLIAALLSWGCPKNDPLQAFNNPPPNPNEPPPAPVPEPVTALLFGTALLIGGAIVRHRRSRNHQ
jgi:hypothetical protein